jgi:hypothetical protein
VVLHVTTTPGGGGQRARPRGRRAHPEPVLTAWLGAVDRESWRRAQRHRQLLHAGERCRSIRFWRRIEEPEMVARIRRRNRNSPPWIWRTPNHSQANAALPGKPLRRGKRGRCSSAFGIKVLPGQRRRARDAPGP